MRRISCVLALVLLGLGVAVAQTVDPVVFFANMSTDQENPPVTGVNLSAVAVITAHVARDASGTVIGATVDFNIQYTAGDAFQFIGLHIHEAAAGSNGSIVIPTDLAAGNPFNAAAGAGGINKQVIVTDVALVNRLVSNPAGFYVNIHTPANPGGAIRGQLAAAEARIFRTRLLPTNEVPPAAGQDVSGSCSVQAIATRDGNGTITGGIATFDVNYRFTGDATLTGLHLHNGVAGQNAGVVIGTNLSATNSVAVTGSGTLQRFVPITTATQLTNFRLLFQNPAGLYCNVHTSTPPFTGGIMRGQMQNTNRVLLRTVLAPQNEVPQTNVQALGAGNFAAWVTRDGAGRVTGGTVNFNVSYAFPGQVEFTGLHIHRAAAGTNGDVVINSGLSATSTVLSAPGGIGDIFRQVNIDADNPTALTNLNDLISSPDKFYMNLHTTVNPAGVIRGQMAVPLGPPAINTGGIINAVGDASIAAAAPGGIISIFGNNMAAVTSEAGGLESSSLPISLNGTEVRIAGRQAPLYFVSPLQINAQVPFETPTGNAQVFVVRPGDVFSAPYTLTVSQFAPGVFIAGGTAIVTKTDFSLITPTNPAAAGDVLVIFCTGLGVTTPPVGTGFFTPVSPLALVSGVTATIGGQNAPVIGTALSSGFVGLYQVAVTMPTGVPAGSRAVVVTAGGKASNSANIAVK